MADKRVRRWQEQRWILDAVIRTLGVEWDQPRLAYMAAPAGPEAMAEFRMVGARVKKLADIAREFAAAARRREARAAAFEQAGRAVAARESWLIAALLWATARWPIFEVDDRLVHIEERMNDCYRRYAARAAHPIESAEIPFGDAHLPAYLHLPRAAAAGERFPCVINIPGMDSSKENGVAMYGDALLQRGIAVLAIDGPGQGECCTLGVTVTATNHMEAARAAHGWLAQHRHVDAGRIALKGTSFGSFFATQGAAALGARLKGCAVVGVCQEPGCHTIFNFASPSFKLRFMFMAGIEDEDEFDRFAATLDLRPLAGAIACPYLAIAGEDDQLSPLAATEELFRLIGAPKTLVVYEGASHAIGDAPSTLLGENRHTLLADWLADRLADKPMRSERIFIDSTGRSHATEL